MNGSGKRVWRHNEVIWSTRERDSIAGMEKYLDKKFRYESGD